MGGIPGKSKGCTTCRRRKIRCDLGKPACSNCLKMARSCEGYERYPIFLNRTQRGLQRRSHLAEAKSVPASMSETQILAWFWGAHSKENWLFYVMEISSPIPTLRQSLRALVVTRYGRLNDDEQWVRQGRLLYSEALGTLQKALQRKPFHDETLASARCLVLYEFLESTSENPDAWEMHLSGMEKLLQFRGRPQSMLSRKVFEDCRYPLMCKAIMRRQISPFSEWLEGDGLYSCGFRIAAMLASSERGEDVRQQCVKLYEDVGAVEEDLHRWAFQLLLLLMMERFGIQVPGTQEDVAQNMLDQLRKNIMGERRFRYGRTLLPVNTLIWYYRYEEEKLEECTRLQQQLAERGCLFARDINKGTLAVVSVLQDGYDSR